ncbi:hypothetical protein EAN88_29805 [Klebsiella pneumoniae]|nr:hypothetical protein EAN88_29805 [Klebsiella pneumoniae]
MTLHLTRHYQTEREDGKKVYFRLSYETMTADTEDFINGFERAGRADCNDPDARLPGTQRDRTLVPPAMAGRAPEDVADRDHLRLTGMLLRAPTAEQRSAAVTTSAGRRRCSDGY